MQLQRILVSNGQFMAIYREKICKNEMPTNTAYYKNIRQERRRSTVNIKQTINRVTTA